MKTLAYIALFFAVGSAFAIGAYERNVTRDNIDKISVVQSQLDERAPLVPRFLAVEEKVADHERRITVLEGFDVDGFLVQVSFVENQLNHLMGD